MTADTPSETATLRDGTTVVIRNIRPDDAPRLQAAFTRLSPDSVYLRFLDQRRALSDRDAERLANVDGQTHFALAATVEEKGEELIIGVARYAIVGPSEPDTAEAAVTVIDDYQRRGLGTILVQRLVGHARANGVRAFVANVHYSNAEILRFIERSGLPTQRKLQAGIWEIKLGLDPESS